MRWALTKSTDQLHYWKLEQDEFSTELKYNHQVQSFRQVAGAQRLFFIEKTGFLQQKFLVRTEYSVITGEIFPLKNWRYGMIVFEEKKYSFFLKDHLLTFTSKKQDFTVAIKITDSNILDQYELYALLFGALRVFARTHNKKTELVLAR